MFVFCIRSEMLSFIWYSLFSELVPAAGTVLPVAVHVLLSTLRSTTKFFVFCSDSVDHFIVETVPFRLAVAVRRSAGKTVSQISVYDAGLGSFIAAAST